MILMQAGAPACGACGALCYGRKALTRPRSSVSDSDYWALNGCFCVLSRLDAPALTRNQCPTSDCELRPPAAGKDELLWNQADDRVRSWAAATATAAAAAGAAAARSLLLLLPAARRGVACSSPPPHLSAQIFTCQPPDVSLTGMLPSRASAAAAAAAGGAPTTGIQMGDDAAVKASVQNYYGEVSSLLGALRAATRMVVPPACILGLSAAACWLLQLPATRSHDHLSADCTCCVTPTALSWYRAQVLAKTDDLKTSACCTAVAPPPLVRGVCF